MINLELFCNCRFCASTDIWKSYAARIMAISILLFIIVQLSQVLNSKSGAKSQFWLRSVSLSHCFFLTALSGVSALDPVHVEANCLYGSATMNNVLFLSVFLALVYFRELMWDFSAEVLIMLIVCVVIRVFCSFRSVFRLWTSSITFLPYPFTISLIYVLDYIFGWS
ncbi:hypothetical protein ACFX14_007869 [Malus domestica]